MKQYEDIKPHELKQYCKDAALEELLNQLEKACVVMIMAIGAFRTSHGFEKPKRKVKK